MTFSWVSVCLTEIYIICLLRQLLIKQRSFLVHLKGAFYRLKEYVWLVSAVSFLEINMNENFSLRDSLRRWFKSPEFVLQVSYKNFPWKRRTFFVSTEIWSCAQTQSSKNYDKQGNCDIYLLLRAFLQPTLSLDMTIRIASFQSLERFLVELTLSLKNFGVEFIHLDTAPFCFMFSDYIRYSCVLFCNKCTFFYERPCITSFFSVHEGDPRVDGGLITPATDTTIIQNPWIIFMRTSQ